MKKKNIKRLTFYACVLICGLITACTIKNNALYSYHHNDVEALSSCEVRDMFQTLIFYCKGDDGKCSKIIQGEKIICSGEEQQL